MLGFINKRLKSKCTNFSRISFTLCAALYLFHGQSVYSATIPYWFLNPPTSDREKLIGVGQGTTAADATGEALNQIASKLSVTISSSLDKTERQTNAGESRAYSKELQATLKSQVAAIKFNNFEVTDNAVIDHQIYVMVAVDKNALLADKRAELSNADFEIESLYSAALKKSIIEKIMDLKVMTRNILKTMPLVSLISYLDPSFTAAQYFGRYNAHMEEERTSVSKIHVYVASTKGSEDLIPVLTENLNNSGIAVVLEPSTTDQDTITLLAKAEANGMQLYGSNMVKLRANFEIRSAAGHLVASSKMESKGSSVISFDEAGRVAVRDLDSQIKSQGIFTVLGISKNSN